MTNAKAPLVRATIRDVARVAGVSVTTVSHALNGRGQVDPATRRRVEEAAQALAYRPNRHAQRLRTGEAQMIGLISSMPFAVAGGPSRLGFLMEIAAVAASAALAQGMALVLVPPAETDGVTLDAVDVDAALVVEPSASDASVEHFRRRAVPVVTIGRQAVRRPPPYVDLRSADTVRLLLTHLLERGARRIGLIVGSERRNAYLETEAVYRELAERERMPLQLAYVDEAEGEQGGYRATMELLWSAPETDALCVPVDAFAIGAVQALKDSGRRIPQDVAIATRYDGLRARTCDPPLTAVDLHLEAVAQAAVELLLRQLKGGDAGPDADMPAPTLVPRASTLGPAGGGGS